MPLGELPSVLVGLLSIVVMNVIYMFAAAMLLIKRYLKKKKNNIDITILELTRNGIQVRNERGRREFQKNRGTITFTVRKFGSKIKDNLGYNIHDEDCYISTMGNNRKYLFIAMKDKLVATFTEALESVEWTDEEKKQIVKLQEKVNDPTVVKIGDIPKKLNLNPVIAEQTRFMLDIEKDKADLYKIDEKEIARKMLYASAGIFFFTLIICLVIIVLVLNQTPGLISTRVAEAAQTTPSIIPGIIPKLPG